MSQDRSNRAKRAATPAPDTLTDEERRALRSGCDRSLQGHGLRTIPDLLAELAALPAGDLTPDLYGDGGAVGALEGEGGAGSVDNPGLRRLELTVGDATLAFTPDDVAAVVRELLPRA